MKKIFRWVVLIALLGVGLLYLNSAFFNAWVSGGPPNDYPRAYFQKSIIHFSYFVTLSSAGIMAFIALRQGFNLKKSKLIYVFAVLVTVVLLYPKIREHILIDRCLDSGGSWDQLRFECKK